MKNPFVDKYGHKQWHDEQGYWHREGDLPATISANGDKYWYKNGMKYRNNNLPAVEYANGSKAWYDRNGRCHRYDIWIDFYL